MYEYVDWMKCKHCKCTNTLFKVRVDAFQKKKTGNIIYKCTQTCKLCYLEFARLKNDKYWAKNRDKVLLEQTIYRILNKEKYNKKAREYYKKRRHLAIEQKRMKYRQMKKEKLETILTKAKHRDSLLLFRR